MSVSAPPALSFLRRAAFGLAIATTLAFAGSAAAGESGDLRGQSGLPVAQVDDTLFPLGKPPALIEATGAANTGPALWLNDSAMSEPDRISTGAILSARQLASISAFALPGRIMPAERHIAIGLMLLAGAAMAAVSFGLWRWQVRGLSWEA